jgi:hypothetical protein
MVASQTFGGSCWRLLLTGFDVRTCVMPLAIILARIPINDHVTGRVHRSRLA